MEASISVHVTHIEDPINDHQDPCIYFWGITRDRSSSFLMQRYIASIRHILESRAPPSCLEELNNMEIYCALIKHQWQRVKVPELKLSQSGTLKVFCIDFGATYSIPLACVRTIDNDGSEAKHIRNWPPLAGKFILADMVASRGTVSDRQLDQSTISLLKTHMENHTWKAVIVGLYSGHQGLRLFDSTNQLFVTAMIQHGLGIASNSYQEALKMCKIRHPANAKPLLDTFPVPCDSLIPATILPPRFANNRAEIPVQGSSVPVGFLEKELIETTDAGQRQLQKFPWRHASQNINFSPEQIISRRAVASYIKSLAEFWVQLEPKTVTDIMERLESLSLHPEFINQKTFIASIGKPCLVFYQDADTFFPDDGSWRRGVVEEVNGDTARVYHYDYGYSCSVTMRWLRELPSDYAKQPALAFRCCLFGAECTSEENADAFINRFLKRSIFTVKFLKEVDGILHVRLFSLGGIDLFEKHYGQSVLSQPTEAPAQAAFDDVVTGPFAFLTLTPSKHSESSKRSLPKGR